MLRLKQKLFLILCFSLFAINLLHAQSTQIKGFVDVLSSYSDKKVSFGLGEQDLFITSQINDRISFLGESVFKFSAPSPTSFDVSIERVVIKANIYGNHNILIGKHHTPVNYWNDTYHHGRVFFPTIERPALFSADILPLHTTGVSLQAENLGKLKFGYNLMVGNGIGAGEIVDNDKAKSITVAAHIKPLDGLRLGLSYYYDAIAKGAKMHDGDINKYAVKQYLLSPSLAYFGKDVEFLAEGTLAMNHTDTTGTRNTIGAYAYTGYRIKDKIVPYVRVDYLDFEQKEVFFHKNNTTSFLAGIRYEINYLAVIKLEFQNTTTEIAGNSNKITAQFAVGF